MTPKTKTFRIAFFTAACIVILFSIFSYIKIIALTDAGKLVNRTLQVTLQLEKVIGALKDAETGQRGYLLTNDKKFLATFDKGIQEYPTYIENIQKLTSDNSTQQKNLILIKSLARHRKDYMFKMLEVGKQRYPTVNELLAGNAIMDSLRLQVDKMIAIENGLMTNRQRSFENQVILAPSSLLLLSLIALAIIITAVWQLNKTLKNAQQLKEQIINDRVATEKETELQSVFLQAPSAIAVLKNPNMIFSLANICFQKTFDRTELTGLSFETVFPELPGTNIYKIIRSVFDTGKPFKGDEITVTFKKDGINKTEFYNFLIEPLKFTQAGTDEIMIHAAEVTEQVLARKTIEENKNKLQSIIDNAPVAIGVFKGRDLVIENPNQEFIDIVGKGPGIAGKKLTEVMPELITYGQPYLKILDDVFTTGKMYQSFGDALTIVRNGKVQHGFYDINYVPQFNAAGEVYAILDIATDVTEQILNSKKIEESEQQYRQLANLLPPLVWQTDASGVQTFASSRWKEFTGFDPEDAASFEKIVHPDDFAGIMKAWTHSLATGEIYNYEVRLKCKEGAYHWFMAEGTPVKNKDGNIEKWIGAFTNINEQKNAEIAVQKTMLQLQISLSNVPAAVYLFDKSGEIHFANEKAAALMGYASSQQLLNASLAELYKKAAKMFELLTESGEPYPKEKLPTTLCFATGKATEAIIGITDKQTNTKRWLHTNSSPILNAENKVEMVVTSTIDITKEREAEQAIWESEERYATTVYASNLGLYDFDALTGKVTAAGKMAEIYGLENNEHYTLEQAVKSIYPDDRERVNAVFNSIMESTISEAFEMEHRIVQKNTGDVRWLKVNSKAFLNAKGKLYRTVGTVADITPQKQAEIKIKESEEQLRQTTEHFKLATTSAEVGTWSLNLASETLEWSGLHKKMWGYHEQQTGLVYEDWHKVILPEDKEAAFAEVAKALKTKTLYQATYRIKRAGTNEVRWIRSSGQNRYDDSGKPFTLTGVSIDITKEKNAELALKESEHRFKTLADFMPQKIWITDPAGDITYINRQYIEFTGLTAEKFSKTWQNFFHPDDLPETTRRFYHSLATGDNYDMEARIKNKDGNYLWHLNRAMPFKDEKGNIIMWIGSDTEIQKTKDEQKRKDDFIKIVSHELKTPVTSIKGYVQLLIMLMEEEKEKYPVQFISSLSRIDRQVLRLTNLITEMLDLARLETGKLILKTENFNISELVTEVVQDIRHTHPKHTIELVHTYKVNVEGDRDRLGQVLINFINNAIKYSPGQEKVEVFVKNGSNGFVSVSVKDYGIGISKEEHEKIFERFYRAEGDNENTFAGFGIGLFIANDIIKKHKGSIAVESKPGKGSMFTFNLPVTK
jgi:PAS domain S-box-containing protein